MRQTSYLRERLEGGLDGAARKFLNDGHDVTANFLEPKGEPALIRPDSVSWRVFKNPVSLFIGGVTAVILEFAEPKIRSGVWDYTSFKSDPVRRLKRTGLAAMITVYGGESAAREMIAGVNRMHARVKGTTSAGEDYRAMDPVLLDWVQATASYGFLEAYAAYVSPLTDEDCDRFYVEAKGPAALYGAKGAPASLAEQQALFEKMRPRFERSDITFEFLDIMRKAKALPQPMRLLQPMLVRAAVDLVPQDIREALGLGAKFNLNPAERFFVKRMGRRADRIVLKSGPPAQACMRLGLPADYLYRQ